MIPCKSGSRNSIDLSDLLLGIGYLYPKGVVSNFGSCFCEAKKESSEGKAIGLCGVVGC